MLGKPEVETRVELRTQYLERRVANRLTLVVKPNREIGTPLKPLLVREVSRGGVHRRGRAKGAGRKNTVVIDLKGAGYHWIKAVDERAATDRKSTRLNSSPLG